MKKKQETRKKEQEETRNKQGNYEQHNDTKPIPTEWYVEKNKRASVHKQFTALTIERTFSLKQPNLISKILNVQN